MCSLFYRRRSIDDDDEERGEKRAERETKEISQIIYPQTVPFTHSRAQKRSSVVVCVSECIAPTLIIIPVFRQKDRVPLSHIGFHTTTFLSWGWGVLLDLPCTLLLLLYIIKYSYMMCRSTPPLTYTLTRFYTPTTPSY